MKMFSKIWNSVKQASAYFAIALILHSSLNADQCPLPDDVNMELLRTAWKIPTGGSQNKPYYSLIINGEFFQGERLWNARWDLLKDALDFEGARILEIGSNVGLASTYLLKFRGASSATNVDRTEEGLKEFGTPRLIEAANLVHEAFDVNINMLQLDLNDSNYEDLIGTNYDIAIAMSILKWVDDKERFLDFLANFNNIIYEGHDKDSTEIERFTSRGFDYVVLGSTQIGISYPGNATRTLIYFYK